MLLPWNLKGNSSWSKKILIILGKIKIFVNTWNFWQFLVKLMWKVRNWDFFFTHVNHVIVNILCTANFISTISISRSIQIIILLSPPPQNHLTLLKNQFLKKSIQKRLKSKHPSPFLYKTTGSNNSNWKQFYSNWEQFQVFKIAKFEVLLNTIIIMGGLSGSV